MLYSTPDHLHASYFHHALMHMAPHVTRALLIQCTCEWHAGLLHNDGSDSITVHGGVILPALMIPNAACRHSK